MRFLSSLLFILFNIYLIESVRRTESETSRGGLESEKSEIVPVGAEERSDEQEDVVYEEYEYDEGRENSISGKNETPKGNSTDSSVDGFPNEVFLSLRNITADAATAFRSFTNRNDVVDLQASASDNLNVTANSTFGDAESAGINMRALRDAGHPPLVIADEPGAEALHLPYKHTKIDTADLSDCALQGEWKPMGVAYGHLHVGGDQASTHQAEVLQSVGSYAVPNKIIPLWQQNQVSGGGQQFQDVGYSQKPSGLYAAGTGGGSYGSSFGYSSGLLTNGGVHSGGFSGLGQFQKIKSASMLSPPPIPPIIFGKKPGYWKLPKPKHKFFPGKGRRPGGYSGGGSYGFSSQVNHGVSSGFGSGLGHGSSGGYVGAAVVSSYGGHGGLGDGFVNGGGGGLSISGGSGQSGHVEGGSGVIQGVIKGGSASVSGYGGGGSGGQSVSSHKGHQGFEGGVGGGFSSYGGGGQGNHAFGGGVGGGFLTSGGGSHAGNHGFDNGVGFTTSGGGGHGNQGFGGGDGGVLSISDGSSGLGHEGVGGGAIAGHLIAPVAGDSGDSGDVEELSGGDGYAAGGGATNGHLISGSALGSAGGAPTPAILVQSSGGGLSGGHLVSLSHGSGGGDSLVPEAAFLSTELRKPSGQFVDSSFSSSHVSQGLGGGNSLPDAGFLSSHLNQDFAVHGQGVSDDLSSSSTFTCGKNHDHNTNYHTATFQVADHDHPSSVDVIQYGGDSAVLIQSGDASFHHQILPERKHYKASPHLSDADVSGSDNRNELTTQTAKLTKTPPTEQDTRPTDTEATKLDDGEEPERHSYYHEITKVTKIPATSVGSVHYTFSQYETKPQTFSTGNDTPQDEPESEQPQIINELQHLSNKFQLDLENPQKLFEDPPTQELAYHYPFQDDPHHTEPPKEQPITEFPYQFYQNNPNKLPHPQIILKKPILKYIPRPGKPNFHPKPPLVLIRKPKPKQFHNNQNYEVHEHSGERHRPLPEIFPPQKFPKQFHNPKPNFAVDRPKNGWRPDVQEYKYEFSHGKKIRKVKTKGKLVGPVLIRRPVSPAPVIRVVEVSG